MNTNDVVTIVCAIVGIALTTAVAVCTLIRLIIAIQ